MEREPRKVTIKGTGSGVILVLDENTPFEELRGELKKKITASAHFFNDARIPIRVRGRDLSAEEQEDLLGIIRESAHLTVPELIVEPPVHPRRLSAEEVFSEDPGTSGPEGEEERYVGGDTEELSAVDRAILKELEKQLSGEFAIMHAGPVKRGETIRSEHSLIILGDVRSGARVEAVGNIIVLGSLFGEAAAGSDGNLSAVVISNRLRPSSLSIGALAGYSAPSHLRKRPFGKKRLMEVACVKEREVVRMAYSDFIRDNGML